MSDDKVSALERKLAEIRREAEERDAKRRSEKSAAPYVDLGRSPASLEAVELVPEEDARAARAAAVQLKGKEVALAAQDPQDPAVKALVDKLSKQGYSVKLFTGSASGIAGVWQLYKFVVKGGKDITGQVELDPARFAELLTKLKTVKTVTEELSKTDFASVSTTLLLESVLAGALANRASDIHFEAEEKESRVRYRLDGVLHDILKLPKSNYESLVSRIKLLSELKINVHGEPQDGRFTIELPKKKVEVRVSIIPSEFGETIVMRLLDPESINVGLEDLGLRPDDLALVNAELEKPHGLILNTGPTGSGKTTTLYAFLKHMVNPEIKIITVEDPIEYRIDGIEQTQVNPEVGYTFAGGLRAIVRQDPDVILVGEIRDGETADIALQAALTGHMVFSTLHTNDAVGAVPRLLDLGAKPVSIGPALSLVIAQRLVRVLCAKCKKPAEVPADMQAKIKSFLDKLPQRVDRATYAKPQVFAPQGCEECNGLGYKGRRGIFEFFAGGPELEGMLQNVSTDSLNALAQKQGMVYMQQDGILKVITGLTTFEEVESVTGPIKW